MAESPNGQHHKRTATNDYSRERERRSLLTQRERERERGTRKEKECVNGLDPRADFIRVHEMR